MTDTAIGKSASEAAALAAAAAAVDLALARSRINPLNSIPAPGPVINFVGHAATAVWDDVWGFVKSESKSVADQAVALPTFVGESIKTLVETYVGYSLGAVSGFINDLSDYTHTGLDIVNNFAIDAAVGLSDDIVGIDGHLSDIFDLLGHVVGIDIPNLEALLGDIAGAVDVMGQGVFDLATTWAIDNIETPLVKSIAGIESNIYGAVGALIAEALAEAKTYADAKTAAVVATIAGTAAAAATATTWIEDCGAPMCETVGPKTDLGKWLKALNLAADAAILAELLTLTPEQLAERITAVVGKFASLAGDFETYFAPNSTETLGGLLKGAGLAVL